MKLKDARTITPEELLERRKQAIMLHKQGMTNEKIGIIAGVHRNTVGQWIAKWTEGGSRKLAVKSSGRPQGSGRHLTCEQEKTIRRKIIDTCPEQTKMDFALWTREAVRQLIQQDTKMMMPIRTVGEYLKRWGFTPQKPVRRAYERNPKKVREWLEETYPGITHNAHLEGAEIQWGDETGLRSDDVNGRGYAPKGNTPVRLTKGTPEKINMISSVTNKGKSRFMFYQGTLNVAVFLVFLQRLIYEMKGRKIYLIVDNLRVHHAKIVQEWVLERHEKIALYFLPSYSPDLNPDEYLNGDLKGEISRRADSRRKGRLAKSARSAMCRIQKNRQRVKNYFEAESIRYAR